MVAKFRSWWQRPKRQASADTSKARRLWGNEFPVVNHGLAEDQVVAFVDDLMARYQAALQQQESASPSRAFSKQVVAEAEREAAAIRARTKRDAEVEAARIIAEAKEQAQGLVTEAKRRAEGLTEKEVRNILLIANKKAELTETQAKQLAQRFFIQARDEIQGQITAEVKEAYYRLLGTLQELLTTSQGIEAEWKTKTLELWGAPIPELEKYQAGLLDSFPTGEFSPPIQVETPTKATIMSEQPPQEESPRATVLPEQPSQEESPRATVIPERPSQEESPRATVIPKRPSRETHSKPKETPSEETAPAPEAKTLASLDLDELTEESSGAPGAVSQEGEPPRHEASWEVVASAAGEQARAEAPQATEPAPEAVAPAAPAPKPPEPVHPDQYSGEVALVLSPPVDVARVATLYEHLQNISGLKVLHTTGSWEEGTVVTVVLEKPSPLVSMLQAIPMLEATPYSKEGGGHPKTTTGPLGDRGKRRERIAITFKGQEEPGSEEETVTGEA